MPKLSVLVRQRKREKLVKTYAEKRKKLKEEHNYLALDKLAKDSSPVRLRNRCFLSGRGRGFIRKFGLSRMMFREMSSYGKIPGVKKDS